jgi:DNA polymerase-3 subunit beta
MKLKLDRSTLLPILDHVTQAVEHKETIPILKNMLVATEPGQLCFRATNLDVDIRESVAHPADMLANDDGTTINADMFHEIVKKLPKDATISLDVEGTRATLKAGRSRFVLHTLPKDDYPSIAAGELNNRFTITHSDFARLIDAVNFAVSKRLPATIFVVFTSKPWTVTFTPSPPTDTCLRASLCRCRPAPRRCRESSSRAKPSIRCAAC